MVEIRLTNSKTRKKEGFEPLDPRNVRMYLCGPTVYDRAHLGNARPVVVFDVLYRLLRHVYGNDAVTYVRNFTDVDDKINARAAATGRSIREITDETIGWYHDDMDALGAMRPDFEPRATDYVPQMVAMIGKLIADGHAYEANGHVLFDVRSYSDYGKLSGRSVDDMVAGARVEVAPFKRDPMDFVLWKPSNAGEPGWESPWGHGRPGWHIECSAMSEALLGRDFDIHGGGLDLLFPHHENEVAQSCCAYPEHGFARVWLHNEMLQVEGRKMSKSLGNFFTVRDLLDQGIPGEVIRYVMLMTHYRKPMDWTAEKVREAEATLRKWRGVAGGGEQSERPASGIVMAIADDLNTPEALAVLHEMYRSITQLQHRLAHFEDEFPSVGNEVAEFVASAQALGLLLPGFGDWLEVADDVGERIMEIALARREARRARDFATADRIRTQLEAAGVLVKDGPGNAIAWERGPNFDPAKLSGIL